MMMPPISFLWVIALTVLSSASQAAEHLIHPGDAPQQILDQAAAGNRLVFLPGRS